MNVVGSLPHANSGFPNERDDRARGIGLLLVDVRSPINFGMILRLAETFAAPVAAYDPSGVLDSSEKLRTISDFACGAWERIGAGRIDDPIVFMDDMRQRKRRLIATAIDGDTTPLRSFRFRRGDVVLLGNEYDGLSETLRMRCDATLQIELADVWTPKPKSFAPIDPTRTLPVANDGKPNLNVAIAAGVICHAAFAQRRTRGRT